MPRLGEHRKWATDRSARVAPAVALTFAQLYGIAKRLYHPGIDDFEWADAIKWAVAREKCPAVSPDLITQAIRQISKSVRRPLAEPQRKTAAHDGGGGTRRELSSRPEAPRLHVDETAPRVRHGESAWHRLGH